MRRVLTLALALPLVASCSGGRPTAAPTPSEASVPSATSSPTPSPTSGPTPSPTTSPTVAPTPSAARHVPALDGDVDGDGRRDTIRATATVLSVVLSMTGRTVTAPIHSDAPRNALVLGTADVDRDGFAEVFVQTAEGASTQFVTPYRFDGRALHELQLDGRPAQLGIGGSVTHGNGFRCPKGLLEVLSADSADGVSYIVRDSTYRLGTDQLVLVRSSTVRAKHGDAIVEAAYRPDCGSVGDSS